MVRLGDVLRRSEEMIDLQSDVQYRQITLKLWGKGAVLRGILNGAEIAAPRQMRARRDQFILSRIDARNGALGLVPPELDGAVVSNDFPVFDIVAERILPTYLGWICKTKPFVERCQRASEGTTNRVRLKEERFLAEEIPLPPLTEQRRILERIEALDAKIQEARSLRHQARQTATALGKFSFASFVSEHVSTSRLRDICSQITDGEHATPQRIGERQVPLVTAKNVRDGHLDMLSTDFVSYETAAKCWNRCRPRDNDVLMVCVGATTGRVCRLIKPPEMVIVRSVAMIRANETILDSRYLEYSLESRELQSQIWDSVKQAAQPCLYLNRIGNLTMPVPPLTEQRRIVAYLDDLQRQTDALKAVQSETSLELDALMPSILDKAFRGEL
jgi:type I restriction enzyme S subunit